MSVDPSNISLKAYGQIKDIQASIVVKGNFTFDKKIAQQLDAYFL
jgi:hypothetical protein